MKRLTYIYEKTIVALLASAIGIAAVSCRTDDIDTPRVDMREGLPATLSLTVNLNDMGKATRAAINDEYARTIKNLWVGIYNVETGECTFNRLFTDLKGPENHTAATLDGIVTKSGKSYIVAVANAEDNYGITDDTKLQQEAGLPDNRGGELSALLEKADTWEKYKSISLMLTDPSNIDFSGSDNLAMSGTYHTDLGNDPESWYDKDGNPMPCHIPAGDTKLQGYIHLRRMISYVKFNIEADTNIEIEPISWQVHSNPIIAYLQERGTNSADVSTYFGNRDGYSSNHGVSNLSYDFESGDLTDATGATTGKKGSSFDFYLFENKQTATDYKAIDGDDYVGIRNGYADREREWKNTDGTNTGIYKSLSPTGAEAKPNAEGTDTKNFATYVTFRLKVTYWVKKTIEDGDNVDVNDTDAFTPVSKNTENAVRREGYANYTVHLGYIEGGLEKEKAEDFNCRRNMKYTYNVTVKSLTNIIVEAFNNVENQSGAEGDVTDVQDVNHIELDAHYAVFNIQLSNKDRRNLKWMIEAPYDNVNYSYYADDYREGGSNYDNRDKLATDQFYTWIRFKPTTDENTLRRYRDSEGEPEADIWTLEQLADPATYRGVDRQGTEVTDADSETQLWYTVFVDEYVYHKDADGKDTYINDPVRGKVEGGWHAYVNQNPRIVWIACNNRHISDDKESMYMNSKYMISQNSILTYYSSTAQTPNNTALGLERENETFGLNLAWSQTAWTALSSPNADNGRYNVWYYLSGGNIDNVQSTSGRGWNAMAATKSVKINGTDRTCLTPFKRAAINTDQLKEPSGDKTAQIFMPANIKTELYEGTESKRKADWKKLGPSEENEFIEIITACMSRNRDENGNGIIDVNEMKWYVPTTGKYARIILGRAVIPQSQRLMNFDLIPAYGFKQSNGTYNRSDSDWNTRYHFASSDKKIVWAEEGTSSSDWLQGDWDMGAWQIRCVRNLGANMERVIVNDPVTPAYTYEYQGEKLTFSLSYYEDACKRAPQSNHLLSHDVQSAINQPAAKFKVAENDCNATNTPIVANTTTLRFNGSQLTGYTTDAWKTACDNNYICGRYAQETDGSDRGSWRVPNQKELVMMRREGILSGGTNDTDGWMSCTQEHFDSFKNGNGTTLTRRFFVFYPNRGTISDKDVSRRHVRCVRDVMNN